MKEVEVKARLRNKTEVIKKLQDLGCKLSDEIIQIDQVFAPNEVNTLPGEIGVPFLRIREVNGKYLLTVKIPVKNLLDKYERETFITDPVAMADIITHSGFKLLVQIKKQRQKCHYNNWEICLDEIEGLGSFIEVEELTEDGDSEQIQKNLFEFLKTLGVEESDREHFGYDVMIWQKNSKD